MKWGFETSSHAVLVIYHVESLRAVTKNVADGTMLIEMLSDRFALERRMDRVQRRFILFRKGVWGPG